MDFSTNFMQRATAVLTEAQQLKKYKAMPLWLAIPVGIFMLPIAIAAAVCAAIVYVLGYLFTVVSMPAQRLHKFLHDEGQSVQHATQVIVYLLSWSFVFTAYALLSFFLVMLTVVYSLFSILSYICTLGGFKFHLFATDEAISIEVEEKYAIAIPVIYISCMVALLVLVPAIKTVSLIIEYDYIKATFQSFMKLFKTQLYDTANWRLFFSFIYSAIIFAPNPKKKMEK